MDVKPNTVGTERVSPLQTLLFPTALGLTLLLATGLRFYRLAGQSLWSDEGNSLALAQASLGEIAIRTALDIHPPLYYWLLHGWTRIFGESEISVRSLSAVAGVLLVAVTYRLGSQLFDRRVGLMAAFIAAVSPFQVYYSQEVRMYVLLSLLGALTIWATTGLTRDWVRAIGLRGSRGTGSEAHYPFLVAGYSALYVLGATAGLYTHYAFPLILVATNLGVLAWLWRTREQGQVGRRLVGWLLLQLVPLLLYLPWLPVAWRQLSTWPTPPPSDAGDVWPTIWRTLLFGPVGIAARDAWLFVFGLLALVGIARLLWKGTLPKAVLLLLYVGLPTLLTLALFKPAYLKFLLVASPALCLLLALAMIGGRSERGVSGKGEPGTVLLMALGATLVTAAAWGPLTAYYTAPALARDDYRSMARYLEAIAGPEDAIILNAPGQQEVFGYYYQGDSPVYPLPRTRPLDQEATISELQTILDQSRHIFALYWATAESDPGSVIEGWLDEHAFKATDSWVGNVRLVSYAAAVSDADLTPAEFRLGDHVRLTGYQLLSPSRVEVQPYSVPPPTGSLGRTVPGEMVQVLLRWTTDTPLDARYVVFLQALDDANHLVGQRDGEPRVATSDWKPGQPVLDRHGLLIEPGTPPAEHRIIVGLYDAATGRRLPADEGDFVELGTLAIEKPGAPPQLETLRFQHPADVVLGPLHLLGYDRYKLGYRSDPDVPLHPGDPLHVVLFWQVQNRPQADWLLAMELAWVANPAAPVAEGVFPAAGVNYPTTLWEPGEVVRAQFDLFLPADAPPGEYQVRLHLLDGTGLPGTETFTLAPVSVE